MGVAKKFGVLLCAEDSEYVKKRYGGYYGLFVEMLAEEGERWDVFRVANGEFPDDDEIRDFDGFVITGSCSDAHGNDVWICRLVSLLKKLDSLRKKVLGICFGHQLMVTVLCSGVLACCAWSRVTIPGSTSGERQENAVPRPYMDLEPSGPWPTVAHLSILSRALGGKTGRAITDWDIGVRSIHLSSSSSKLFSSLQIPTTLSIIECHRDEVRELPPKAEIIAWSEKTGVEMFRYGDHMMGIQGHPEYTKDILFHLIDRLTQRCYIEDSYGDELRAKLEIVEPHKDAWKKLCTSFLKGRL
ncbi:Cox19-like CHCH family protein [Hibiscus syriacus]|uniref:Cox19-like CHCH family protein n=1 Tax=Hibiscus syriacus TaxID=106335 RepID=A0A6A3AY40_HIBSY|nr:Cox19-like CHCH family protein [Hibiscus syriacus]